MLQSRKVCSSQLSPFKPEVGVLFGGVLVLFFFEILVCCQVKPWMCQHDILIPPQMVRGAGFGVVKLRIKFLLERSVGA